MLNRSDMLGSREHDEKRRAGREDMLIVSLMLVVGLFPIIVMLVRRTACGVQETIGLLIVMFALTQLTKHCVPRLRSRRAVSSSRRMHRDQIAQEE